VVPTNALYAGPETNENESNAFNRNVLRSRVKGTLKKKQNAILSGSSADPRQAFSKAQGTIVSYNLEIH